MKSLLLVFFSTLFFHLSDAGTFTWLHSDDTVHFVEGETAKLNWSVQIGAGKTWVAVKITRSLTNVAGPADVDLIRRKPSGVEILLAQRGADMDLDVQVNSNVLNITFTLRNLSRKTDEMYYRITVYDDDPDSSVRNTKLNVDVPSSCEIHPNTTTVNETDNVLLNVITTGNPPVNKYIWTHPNGSRLNTNITLEFIASRQDAGTYKVSVYNGVGGPSECTSNVTVQFKPRLVNTSIIKGPLSTVREENGIILASETDSFNLTCESDAKPEATYKWRVPDSSLFTELSQQILVLNSISRDYAGEYICTASNIVGATNSRKNLTVYFPTSCAIYPNATTVNETDTVLLTVTTTGNPSVQGYTWTFPNGSTVFLDSNILTFTASRQDAGTYKVSVYNGVGGPSECTSNVTVQFKPRLVNISIIKGPLSTVREENGIILANETDSFNLSCESDAKPEAKYKWIVPDPSLLTELNQQILVFNKVSRDYAGKYICTASNIVGATRRSKNLTVYFPSSCEIHPNATTVNETDTVLLNVTTTGNPPVQGHTWTFPNGSTVSRDNNILTFTASRQDAGTYKVSVYNGVGGPSECMSTVFVQFPSTCKIHPDVATVIEPGNVSLNVTTTGNPPVQGHTWTFPNGSTVSRDDNILTFTASRQDNGTYKVTVYNGVGGPSECMSNVTVQYVPGKPKFKAEPITVCENKKVNLTCANAVGHPPVNNYALHDGTGGVSYSTSGLFQVHGTKIGVNKYRCIPWNSIGAGKEESTNFTVYAIPNITLLKNNESILPEPVMIAEGKVVKVTFKYSDNLTVTWKKLSGVQSGQRFQDNLIYGLWFNPANRSQNGTYEVTAEGSNCETSKRFTLFVQYKPDKPRISHSPSVSKFCLGSVLNIICASTANPSIKKYNFYRNGEWIGENITGLFKVRLDKKSISRFACGAENQIGGGENATTDAIHVKEPPRISHCQMLENGQDKAYAEEGANVTLRCNISGSEPLNISWANRMELGNDSTVTFQPVDRKHNGTYKLTVNNGEECNRAEKTIDLRVHYFDKPDICSNKALRIVDNTRYAFNVTGNPEPKITLCSICMQYTKNYLGNGKWFYNVGVSDDTHLNYSIGNAAGSCNFKLYKKTENTTVDLSVTIIGTLEKQEEEEMKNNITMILTDVFDEEPYVMEVKVLRLRSGSIIVDFQLIVVAVVANYLEPLEKASKENSPKLRGLVIDSFHNGFYVPTTASPSTTSSTKASSTITPTPVTSLPPPKKLESWSIILIAVVILLVLIGLIVWIVCWRKKNRHHPNRKGSTLVIVKENVEMSVKEDVGARDNPSFSNAEDEGRDKNATNRKESTVVIVKENVEMSTKEDVGARDNPSFSYAEGGPADPDYGSKNGGRKKNANGTKPGGKQEEPTYAEVNKPKKKKEKNPNEIIYADLGEVRKNADNTSRARGGIVLEPLPKGKDVKRPEEYKETIYATIVGTKEKADDTQNPTAGGTNNAPLSAVDDNPPDTDEGAQTSGQAPDPPKNEEQKLSNDQQSQPLTKEDSGKDDSDATENSVTKF